MPHWLTNRNAALAFGRCTAGQQQATSFVLQAEVATALESFFRVGATGGGKTNDRFDALMQAWNACTIA